MINNMIHFLLSHPKARSLFTVRPQQTDVLFLRFDVAKLGYTRRKSKKTASTTYFTNPLLINILQKVNLYNTTTGASTENEANDKYLYKGGS